MSYPAFGKVKTLVLPCLLEGGDYDVGISLDTYKLLFGVDLRDYIYLEDNEIKINAYNTQFLLQPYIAKGGGDLTINTIVAPNRFCSCKKSSNVDARLDLYFSDTSDERYIGIRLMINNNLDFVLDNVRIYPIFL